jgi:quaternary ammonium compound-resistance protein SugE
MAWVTLFLAGLLEIAWALLLKQSAGFTRPAPTAGFLISAAASMYLLAYSLKSLPVGTAYAVWTGIGAAGTAIIGMLWLGEPRDTLKLVSLIMLIGGIAGLRLTSGH